jgi:superfamily II DNA or RNA helicase
MALHRQQIGRVMRACPGKTGALILDHAGNTHRHGLPTDEISVSLEGEAKRKQEAAPRTCKKCFAVTDSYPCWCCGYEPEEVVREIATKDGDLSEIPPDSPEQRRQWYAAQVAMVSDMGWKLGAAKYRYKQRYSVWPRFREEDAKYVCPGHVFETRTYGTVCARCLRSPEKATAAAIV